MRLGIMHMAICHQRWPHTHNLLHLRGKGTRAEPSKYVVHLASDMEDPRNMLATQWKHTHWDDTN